MADNDNFHAPAHDLPEETQPAADSAGNATEAPPPERLRVHSLARVLGTTSRRIIDALVELDGRARSAHSTVGREEADRVRQALAEAESSEAVAGDAAAEPSVDSPPEPPVDSAAEPPADLVESAAAQTPAAETAEEEPESRLILETPAPQTAAAADYLPLFVAPQPVRYQQRRANTDDEDDVADAGEDSDAEDTDSDDGQSERPSGKRRRRGRRGRGRGRGEQNGDDTPDGEADGADDTAESDRDSDNSGDSDDDSDDDDSSSTEGGNRRRRRHGAKTRR